MERSGGRQSKAGASASKCHQKLRFMAAFHSIPHNGLAGCLIVQGGWPSLRLHHYILSKRMGGRSEASSCVLLIRKAKSFPEASSRLLVYHTSHAKYKGAWENNWGVPASIVNETKEKWFEDECYINHKHSLYRKKRRKKSSDLSFSQTGHSELSLHLAECYLDLFVPR